MNYCLWIITFMLFYSVLNAQDTDVKRQWSEFTLGQCYEIKTRMGTTHKGQVLYENQNSIILENKPLYDSLIIPKMDLVSYTNCGGKTQTNSSNLIKPDAFNAHSAHLLFGRSARTEKTGSAYYTSHYFLSDNFGFTPSPYFSADVDCFLFVPYGLTGTGHYPINSELHLCGGASVYGNIFQGLSQNGIELFLVTVQSKITFGNQNNHITFGLYGGGLNLEALDSSASRTLFWFPFGYMGYYKKMHERFSICAEAWYLPALQVGMGGVGFRYHSGKYKDWTFGFLNPFELENVAQLKFKTSVVIPYIGYKYILN